MALIPVAELPKTRLELRWRELTETERRDSDYYSYTVACDYDLILELDEFDIRGEVRDDEGVLKDRLREKRLTLGGTRSTGTVESRLNLEHGEIQTPFRDGSHILWDHLKLKLPAYAVVGEWAMDVVQWRQALAIARGEKWP